MKIKVSETTPIQLDWLVAKALGFVPAVWEKRPWGRELVPAENPTAFTQNMLGPMGNSRSRRLINPTTDWSQGGPIIGEMLKSGVTTWNFMGECFFELAEENILQKGSTPLIAGLRCYVASKLGDEVEIPEELL